MGMLVDITRQHLLARAGLAGNQHSGIAARHPCRQLQQLYAGRLEGYRPLLLDRPQATQGMARHQVEQRLGLERLDQVVDSPLAHGVHRTLHRAMGGHQQHRQLWLAYTQQAKQLMAVHARHVDITDHQAEGLGRRGLQSRLRTTHGLVVMTGQQERVCEGLAQGTIVFNQ